MYLRLVWNDQTESDAIRMILKGSENPVQQKGISVTAIRNKKYTFSSLTFIISTSTYIVFSKNMVTAVLVA